MLQTIDRKKLLKDIENVKKGLATKDLIEQSTSFIFTAGKAIAFNDEIFAIKDVDLDLTGVVEAESFLKLLNKVKDEEIKIETEDQEIKIKGKKFSAGMQFDSDIRIPINEVELPNNENFTEVQKGFSDLVKRACLTAGRSLSEPLLTCVHFCNDRIESCDNDRITICTLADEYDVDVLISASNLLEIARESITGFFVDESWAHFKIADETILSTRLYNEEYVNLDQYLPDKDSKEYIELPKNLSEIIDRASIFSKDKISMENVIDIKIKNKKMTIYAESESKWFSEKTVIKTDKNISFSINADFLKDMLQMTNKFAVIDDYIYFDLDNSVHIIGLEEGDKDE